MNRRLLAYLPALVLLLSFFVLSCSDDDGSRPVVTLAFTPSTMPSAFKDAPYSQVIGVSGGTAPYALSISQGALPPGVTSDPSTDSIAIAGTPTTLGTYSFTVRAEDANDVAGTKAYVIQVVEVVGVSGAWSFTVDVTAADGVCAGEENAPPSTDTITITQTPTSDPNVFTIAMAGFLGDPAITLNGTMTGANIVVAGSYPEDGGTTTSSHNLNVTGPNTISGVETWSWIGPGGSCPNGLAEVTATRR